MRIRGLVAIAVAGMLLSVIAARSAERARESMTKIVEQIQRADYEGDRAALARLAAEIAPYADNRGLASRAHYWRGFASWRRTLNGFNEKDPDAKELERDLVDAVKEFRRAAEDPTIAADAKSAAAACSWSIGWLNRENPDLFKKHIGEGAALIAEAKKAEPENPRVLWVAGGGEWYIPPERGGGQDKAIATFQRGLELARKQRGSTKDSLEPAWGEAELHMNLAWAYQGRAAPDLAAAESNARAAVALVPHWHYVRDIMLPGILEARAKPAGAAAPAATSAASAPSVGKKPSPADFDFLEGTWDIVYNNSAPGVPPNMRGRWAGRKEADGRVLSDEFRLLGPNGETVYLCTTYRVFDHVRGQWDMRFLGLTTPGAPTAEERRIAQWAELTAWPEGSTIRVDQKHGDFQLRITYYEISKDRFRWKADVSTDGGKTWKPEQIRIEAKRVSS